MSDLNWNAIATGVITGVLSATITGIIPFWVQCRWRKQDRADGARSARLAESSNLARILGECIANHELTMQSGHFNTVVIMKNLPAIKRETSAIAARLDAKRAAELRALVEKYGETKDYATMPGLALERARALQRLCGG